MNAWQLLKTTYREWLHDKVPRLGAALAFYSMLSIGPLMLLALSAAALLFGEDAAQGRVMQQIDGLIGREGARAIQEMLASAAQKDEVGWFAAIVGFVTLLLGASGVFGQLQDALNTIWGVEPKPGRGVWGIVRARFFSVSMVFGTGFLLLISLLVSAALAVVSQFGAGLLPGMETMMQLINASVSLGFTTFLFALIFKYVPDAMVCWRDVWVGALITALLFTLGKLGIGLYLGHSAMSSGYGAAGSLVVVLVWVYYSAQILFFGAEFTQVYANRDGVHVIPAAGARRTSKR